MAALTPLGQAHFWEIKKRYPNPASDFVILLCAETLVRMDSRVTKKFFGLMEAARKLQEQYPEILGHIPVRNVLLLRNMLYQDAFVDGPHTRHRTPDRGPVLCALAAHYGVDFEEIVVTVATRREKTERPSVRSMHDQGNWPAGFQPAQGKTDRVFPNIPFPSLRFYAVLRNSDGAFNLQEFGRNAGRAYKKATGKVLTVDGDTFLNLFKHGAHSAKNPQGVRIVEADGKTPTPIVQAIALAMGEGFTAEELVAEYREAERKAAAARFMATRAAKTGAAPTRPTPQKPAKPGSTAAKKES